MLNYDECKMPTVLLNVLIDCFINTIKTRSSEILRRVAFVRTDISEECVASVISGDKNRRATNNFSSDQQPKHAERNVISILQEPHDVSSEKTAFIIVTAVRTSILT
jgi:hypothetical protein